MVTGGTTGNVQPGIGTFFSSTEILVVGETEWKFTGDLPTKRRHLRGVSFQNRIFMTGNSLGDFFKSIKYIFNLTLTVQ